MDHTYWLKQGSEALFPDIVWSRPETKTGAGKVLVVGGNRFAFGAVGMAYATCLEAGVGECRVLLPDAVKKIVHGILPDAAFAPSNPSGSFSKQALAEIISSAGQSNAVLLAGDFGRNSETAILLERFVEKYPDLLVVTQDAIDYFKETPLLLVNRANCCVVLSLSQLQKYFINTPTITPITLSMSTLQLVEALHAYTEQHPAAIITKHNGLLLVAKAGLVSTTKTDETIWRVKTAAKASVYWLQSPAKQFEAITTSLLG